MKKKTLHYQYVILPNKDIYIMCLGGKVLCRNNTSSLVQEIYLKNGITRNILIQPTITIIEPQFKYVWKYNAVYPFYKESAVFFRHSIEFYEGELITFNNLLKKKLIRNFLKVLKSKFNLK